MRTLKGAVDLLGLGNLLQILSMNGREGILTLIRDEDRKSVHFGPEGIRLLFSSMRRINKLGKILLRRRRISKDDLDALLKEQRLLGWKLGQVALTSGLVRKEDVETALLEQIEEEVFDIFMWTDASFEFAEGKAPPRDSDHPLGDITFGKNVTQLILEAAARADEYLRIRAILVDDDLTLAKLPFDVQADELGDEIEIVDHLLPMLNGRRSVREVVATSIYPRFTTLRALYRLLTLGYIKAKNKKGDTVTVARMPLRSR
ncbi:MAG TPA: DUF4388 domain-containing protein [Planctomycetota bacterium]